MPNETKQAVKWALEQCMFIDLDTLCVVNDRGIDRHLLVDFVREYFNDNDIRYSTFDFNDVKPFLPKQLLN